jgi:uncharacterized RDD family membrane protein YckC
MSRAISAGDVPAGLPLPSTVWRRIMGSVYEAFLLVGPLLVLSFIYSVVVDFSDQANPDLQSVKRFGLQLLLVVIVVGYFTWSWSRGRCSLPMQTLGLQVQLQNGDNVPPLRALARAVLALPSIFLGVGLLWAVFDRDSQTLHDRMTGTRLVHIPVKRIL